MFAKINSQIEEFTSTIKEVEGCDKMLTYMDSNIYSAIKLLMFASKTFSVVGRVLLFFVIFLTGLLILTAIGALGFNISILVAIILGFFSYLLYFVMNSKKMLIQSIKNTKETMSR